MGATVGVGDDVGVEVGVFVFVGDGDGVGVRAGATNASVCLAPAASRLYPLPATRAGDSLSVSAVPMPNWP